MSQKKCLKYLKLMNADRFKFRVWDNKTKQYLNTADLYIDSNGTLCEYRYVWGTWEVVHDIDTSNLVIEQCTGLKDADGKLIYENDVLQTPSCRYRVKYDDKTCGFVCDEYLDGCSALLLHSDLASKKYRVIGNIHENPERLEGNK